LARAMVTEWGYSDELGKVAYGENQQEVFLGHSVAQSKNVSEETAQKIDAEVRQIIDVAYDTATKIIKKKKKDWETLSQALLEYETLSGDEIVDLLNGKPPNRDEDAGKPPSRGSAVPSTGASKKKGGEEPDSGDMEPQPT
ncbi:MAG: cell division protein FtsH, partial [Pseudomonadota bacterium]